MARHVRLRKPARHARPTKTAQVIATGTSVATGAAVSGVVVMTGPHAALAAPAVMEHLTAPAVAVHAVQSDAREVHWAKAAQAAPQAPAHVQAPAHPMYTVKSGDYLSKIAQGHCSTPSDWTGIYETNKKTIGNDPNLILDGQHLALDCRIASVKMPVTTAAVQSHSATPQNADEADSSSQPTSQAPSSDAAPSGGYAVQPASQNNGNYSVSSGFQACVIRAESGGNAQIWNASGHWGLYQFSRDTWVAHGGDPALFGNADGAYQTQIFWNTVRQDGTSDWAPYDGC